MRISKTTAALWALGGACFVSVTSEYLPVALLPQLSSDLGISGSAIGLLVTWYAIVVAVSVVPLVAATARWERRTTALVTVGALLVSNLLMAIASNYAVLVVARVVAAFGHGVFWSVVAAMAARLVGRAHAGRATAVVFAGNSLAFLLGLPLLSWLGSTIGWRPTVLATAAAAAVSAIAVRASVGRLPAEQPVAARRRSLLRSVIADRRLAAVNVVTALVVTGHFAAFTYITVIIADYTHRTGSQTASVLLLHGAAGLLGLLLIGRTVDAYPRFTALIVTGGLAVCMLALLVVGPSSRALAMAAVVLWAVPVGGMAVVLQAAVLRVGADRDLASAVYIVAFQLGIALGAGIGGLGVSRDALPVTIAIAAACALVAVPIVCRTAAFSATAEPSSPILEHR
ncbi:MFS transporter [Nocardia brasiliensis]|uniref:MFS transporter n=1 Tax=Nocardia brasiliensis TaxID=37326 RepID=UPI0024557A6F|nr:MFS transporter [Nocardia brasiliensis]